MTLYLHKDAMYKGMYWLDAHKLLLGDSSYFREGMKDLQPSLPTWFSDKATATHAAEAMGFSVVDGVDY
jgi:hypothetical protein